MVLRLQQACGKGHSRGSGRVPHTMRSKGRMKQRLASSSVGAQSQRSRRLFRSSKRLYVKCSTAASSLVSSLQAFRVPHQQWWIVFDSSGIHTSHPI